MWVANLERRHQGLIRHCCFWILSQILRWYHPAMVFGFGLFIHTRQYGPWLVSYLISKSWTEQKGLAPSPQVSEWSVSFSKHPDNTWYFSRGDTGSQRSVGRLLAFTWGATILQSLYWQSMPWWWPIETVLLRRGLFLFSSMAHLPQWRNYAGNWVAGKRKADKNQQIRSHTPIDTISNQINGKSTITTITKEKKKKRLAPETTITKQ